MIRTSALHFRRPLIAAAAVALLAATAFVVPSGPTAAQGATEEYVFATFDTPVGDIVTGELNGVGFTIETFYEGPGNTGAGDPITVEPCDLSGADYDPAGPADGECANTWARDDYFVTFDEPIEGLRVYFQGLRGEQDGAGGSDEYYIRANDLECSDPEICWEVQSGLDGTTQYDPFDGYLVTDEVGLVNGVLFVGPTVDAVSEFSVVVYAGQFDTSLMGVTFAVPVEVDPTTTTPTPEPTTTAPAGTPVSPRFTG